MAEPETRYDPVRLEEQLFKQPFKWLVRNVELFIPLGMFLAKVLLDIQVSWSSLSHVVLSSCCTFAAYSSAIDYCSVVGEIKRTRLQLCLKVLSSHEGAAPMTMSLLECPITQMLCDQRRVIMVKLRSCPGALHDCVAQLLLLRR